MDSQKDNKISNIGQHTLPSLKGLNDSPIYEFVNKKTEKLVTALYMVTDCMESDDALKNKLRFLGVDLLSDMYKLSIAPFIERHTFLQISISKVSEILSFVDIASTIGFISDMNTNILKREFNLLIEELQSHLTEKKNLSFVLDEKMLQVERPKNLDKNKIYFQEKKSFINKEHIKDKRTYQNNNNNVFYKNIKDKNYTLNKAQNKEERVIKIISIIKDKCSLQKDENNSQKQNGISIKDISMEFKDCSEKTIQRELNDLVLKGELIKKGEKRWSRYLLSNSK